MRIAIISDTHDNIWKLDSAMPQLAQADAILHCGDLCSPFMITKLAEGVPDVPVHIIWGNNDGDKHTLLLKAAEAGNILIHGELAELTMGGLKIAMNHYPKIARALAETDRYDVVCYGHDHKQHEENVGRTLLINPGEVMGLYGRCTLALLGTENKKIAWVDIG